MNTKYVKYYSVYSKGASSVHVRCMTNACASIHGAKYAKHTTNDQNMINIHNHGNSQKLVLIGVQNNKKMPFGHFIKHLRVHTLYIYIKQCMNIWKSCLNTCYFCHKGATSNANYHLKQNPIKRLTKIKFSNSHLRKSQLWT